MGLERQDISEKLLTSIVRLATLQEEPTPLKQQQLLDSPLARNEGLQDSVELRIARLAAKYEDGKDQELVQVLKLALMKLKQQDLALKMGKSDADSKIERLEVESDLLLREIEFIKKRGNVVVTRGDAVIEQSQVTPITTPRKRRIKVIETTQLKSPRIGHKRGHSDPGVSKKVQFFHYYSQGQDENESVDNRRSKKSKTED